MNEIEERHVEFEAELNRIALHPQFAEFLRQANLRITELFGYTNEGRGLVFWEFPIPQELRDLIIARFNQIVN